jgi:hypothetical protein
LALLLYIYLAYAIYIKSSVSLNAQNTHMIQHDLLIVCLRYIMLKQDLVLEINYAQAGRNSTSELKLNCGELLKQDH